MDSLIEKGKQAFKSVRKYSKELLQPVTAINDVIENTRKNFGDSVDLNALLDAIKQLDLKQFEIEARKLFDEFDKEKLKKISISDFSQIIQILWAKK
ncbi:hypothetical protein GJ496_008739 [Pomphorhynchus laevis]|nr:hypothetical protein GJ496_008739 [Pomphorhynchus laevis]